MIKRSVLLMAFAASLPLPASGQLLDVEIVDRLIAIVGDSVVVQTQIQEEIQRMALGGAPVPEPTDPQYEALFRTVLDQFIDRLVVLQAAAKDSLIRPDEAALDQRVTDRIAQLAQQFGGQPALQQALAAEALSLAEYRDILRNEARTLQVQQMFMQLRLRDATPLEVTENELLERFQQARAGLEQRPKLLTFRQVVITPEASDDAMEVARQEAQALLDRVTAGEDFAALAVANSDDPGSAPLGGDLGWFRRGRMVREFEEAAFALYDDQVSGLVKTDFGYHIIKVERYRAGERQARHILVVPEKSPADVERARAVAEEVSVRARAGESMTALFEEFSDPAAPDSLTFAFDQIGELPPVYDVLRTASSGDFVGPLEYQISPGETRFAVISVAEIREAGAYTFEDLRGQLASQLQQEKQERRLVARLRAGTHIEIRM
ncbi:MAG: peptidylprolyl isomerase [Gemmatimonadetes bacterium]|nr:peptidylprolyl isomerase [Gemmatimonadota bacterium]MDA1104687.1 peptidylprolyl isomerase [Gemmatimonadota bacterium]